jgi:hypothetical protein
MAGFGIKGGCGIYVMASRVSCGFVGRAWLEGQGRSHATGAGL